MSEQENIIELRGVTRTYKLGREKLPVLRGVDWEIRRGEWACLLGASGSGKTTLLNLIGTLEQPDSGMKISSGWPSTRTNPNPLDVAINVPALTFSFGS